MRLIIPALFWIGPGVFGIHITNCQVWFKKTTNFIPSQQGFTLSNGFYHTCKLTCTVYKHKSTTVTHTIQV